jgi:parallel beta-helix repeat protein
MLKTILTIIIQIIFLSAFAGDISIYVSPAGNGNGSAKAPTTLQNAIALLPALKKTNPKGIITIFLNGGDYNLEQPIEITAENGGTKDLQIVFKAVPNAHPVVSGGRKVTMKGTKTLSAIFPDSNNTKPYDLYVNDKRAVRARTPNIDNYFSLEKVINIPDNENKSRFTQQFQTPLTEFKTLASLPKNDLQKVWFNMYHKWDNTIRTIDSLNAIDTSFYSTGIINGDWALIGKPALFYFENYPAALDTVNEWMLQNDTIKYIPTSNVNEQDAVIPVLEKLLIIQGDSILPVKNILFDGIAFKYCNYNFNGYEAYQAAEKIDAAITIDNAEDIRFNHCEIAHTGQYAIWLRKGAQHCEIIESYLHDLGAGGIRIGETVIRENKAQWTSGNKVENCIIHSGGKDFPSAVGIFIAHSANNTISHNDIGDFRYTGISVGWIWGYAFSPSVNNKITYNHIHHLGWGVLSDMAAVYTLGISNGTEVSNNRINDVYSYDYGGWGLYTDEGSSNIIMKNNLVYHTKTGGFHQHYGENNTIRNNIIAFNEKFQAQFTRVEKHHSFDFKNNILVSDKGYFLQGPWQAGDIAIDSNCYWNTNTANGKFIQSNSSVNKEKNYLTFSEWQQTSKKDIHSIMEDPGFVNAKEYNFKFKNRSAITKIGFKPFNIDAAGVTGDKQWKDLAKLPKEIVEAFELSVEKNMLQ